MKKTVRLIAMVIAAGMLTACEEKTPVSDSSSQALTSQTIETQDSGEDDSNSGSEAYKSIQVDTKIKFMSWIEADEDSAASNMFRTLYGTPENSPEGYGDTPSENIFVNISVSTYTDRYISLSMAVQSGDSPDCFPYEVTGYPGAICYGKLFENVDSIFDFTDPLWADSYDIIQSNALNGKVYVPVISYHPNYLLWYRKSVIDGAELADPWDIYENGEWTWNKFLEMCRTFSDKESRKWGVDGYGVPQAFVASTGVPFVGIEDGFLVNNLNDESIIKCMDMLQLFDDEAEQLRYPAEKENGWSPSTYEWVNGNTLFYAGGDYSYGEKWHKYKVKNGWSDEEICFVPLPKMDGADAHYSGASIYAYMLCKGSENVEGYKALVYANLLAHKDEHSSITALKEDAKDYEIPSLLLERLQLCYVQNPIVPVIDVFSGFDYHDSPISAEFGPLRNISEDTYMNNIPYREIVKEHSEVLDDGIALFNENIANLP